jgi:hypothetical protein
MNFQQAGMAVAALRRRISRQSRRRRGWSASDRSPGREADLEFRVVDGRDGPMLPPRLFVQSRGLIDLSMAYPEPADPPSAQ